MRLSSLLCSMEGRYVELSLAFSVWPAWWSQAPNWPTGGEIDTLENVNLATSNRVSLHTEPVSTAHPQRSLHPSYPSYFPIRQQGCTLNQAGASLSGNITSTDCSFQANSNEGCIVTDNRPQSFGEGFAKAGGGMFVTELAEPGVSVWFFPVRLSQCPITPGILRSESCVCALAVECSELVE